MENPTFLFEKCFLIFFTGQHLEYGLRKQGVLKHVVDFDGSAEGEWGSYLTEVSKHARGECRYFCDHPVISA